MSDRETKSEFLKLLINHGLPVDFAITEARKCADFVSGKSDAEIIRAAQELAEKMKKHQSSGG
jgi:hypothetical protein